MFRHLTLFVFAFALCSCAVSQAVAPAASVSLSAARSGSEVTLTLRNDSAAEVQYNLCTSALQRSASGVWSELQTGDVCTMELRSLQPGQSATFVKSLPSGLGSGEYRYVARVHGEATRDLASNPFSV